MSICFSFVVVVGFLHRVTLSGISDGVSWFGDYLRYLCLERFDLIVRHIVWCFEGI